MRALCLGCLVLLLVASARAEDVKPKQEDNDPYPPAFRARINKAVDRGVAYLLARQTAEGSWPAHPKLLGHRLGFAALTTLACLKGGVKPDAPSMDKAFTWMRKQKLEKTYDVGVLLMALHARYAGIHDGFEEEETDRYGHRKIKEPCEKKMKPEDRKWMRACVKFLLDHRSGNTWRYPGEEHDPKAKTFDLSNTQYALLGLWAASRCGVKVPLPIWFDTLKWLLGYQERTGRSVKLVVNEVRGNYRVTWTEKARARGFRYRPEDPVTGSMTTAGLACVAICQEVLWKSRKYTAALRGRTRRAIRDAMAWLQDNFDVTKNPGQPGGSRHYYYLYGMERAGILSRMRFFGRYDWYQEGAEYLLKAQRGSGSWHSHDHTRDTPFAILFLKRSTARTRNPVITPSSK